MPAQIQLPYGVLPSSSGSHGPHRNQHHLDMDRFKDVNDTLGHYNGDRLLKQVGLRLPAVIRESDTLARIGGDEFAFILPRLQEKQMLKKSPKRSRNLWVAPSPWKIYPLKSRQASAPRSFPSMVETPIPLIQRADVAMYAAKQNKTGYALYAKDFDKHSPHRLTLMGELRQAISGDELMLTSLLAAYNFPAHLFFMEIIETSIMVDPERSLAILDRIHQKGVNLSIDDFSTGYSSLAYLKKLPAGKRTQD